MDALLKQSSNLSRILEVSFHRKIWMHTNHHSHARHVPLITEVSRSGKYLHRVRLAIVRILQTEVQHQGVVVLAALNHLEDLVSDISVKDWGSDDMIHAQIEALRLAFFDALHVNADPNAGDVPTDQMICKKEAAKQRKEHKLCRQVRFSKFPFFHDKVNHRLRV